MRIKKTFNNIKKKNALEKNKENPFQATQGSFNRLEIQEPRFGIIKDLQCHLIDL